METKETKVKKFINKFLIKNWSPSSLNKLLTKLHQTLRLWIANTTVVKSVCCGLLRTSIKLRIKSKMSGHAQTIRQIQEKGIPKTSVHVLEAAVS